MFKYFKTLAMMLVLAALVVTAIGPTTASEPMPSSSSVQQGGSGARAFNGQTGALNFINFGSQSGGRAVDANSAAAVANNYASQFGLAAGSQLGFVGSRQSRLGNTYYRFQQSYNGINVIAGEVIVAADARGGVTAMSGEFAQDLGGVATAPRITAPTATQSALSAAARESGLSSSAFRASAPALYYYDSSLISTRVEPISLVYQMEVVAPGQPYNYYVLIDAVRNSPRLIFNQLDTIMSEEDAERYALEYAESSASGEAAQVNPNGPTLGAMLPNYNATAITYDSNDTSDRQGQGASTLLCTDTQPDPIDLTGANSCEGGSTLATPANSAHFFALDTHDLFDLYFGRNSIDDAGMDLISNVNFTPTGNPYANAFWDGVQMTYGNSGYLSTDDIVGHELTHGVTEFSSNLFYYYESGAINESFSDIFGEMVDQLNGVAVDLNTGNVLSDNPADRWALAEDSSIGAIRHMSNPGMFGDPDRLRSPDYHMAQTDGGGVHINSGVLNKATSLMVDGGSFNGQTIDALGATTNDSWILTANIMYESEYLLTSGADYGVLNLVLPAACVSLIGHTLPGTAETMSVDDCYEVSQVALATEMHLEPGAEGYSPEVPIACSLPGTSPVDLYYNDLESGLGDFTFTDDVPDPYKTWYYDEPIDVLGFFTVGFPYAARSGIHNLYAWDWQGSDFGAGTGYVGTAEMNVDVSLTGAVEYYLHIWHLWGLEGFSGPKIYDGVVVEYSTDGGGSWINIGDLFDAGRDYDGNINEVTNPLNGEEAFSWDSHGYVNTQWDLSSLNGEDVRFRWRMATDAGVFDQGYWLDDIRVYACTFPEIDVVIDAECVDEDLQVTIAAGDGPFDITASAGINMPALSVGEGTTLIQGPEKWDDVTVTETTGDMESVNLGQFKCRSDERPTPLMPAHRDRTTDPFPTFAWTSVTDANNYRIFVFDNSNPGLRTVDIRENSGGATSMVLGTALPDGRLFWRTRARQNRVWGLWSVRFTLFKDPAAMLSAETPIPTVELEPPAPPVDGSIPTSVPTVAPEPTSAPEATLPPPPNSRE